MWRTAVDVRIPSRPASALAHPEYGLRIGTSASKPNSRVGGMGRGPWEVRSGGQGRTTAARAFGGKSPTVRGKAAGGDGALPKNVQEVMGRLKRGPTLDGPERFRIS